MGINMLLVTYNLSPFSWKLHMGVSKNRGTPTWMVYKMENPIKIDDLGGPPLFLDTPISPGKKVPCNCTIYSTCRSCNLCLPCKSSRPFDIQGSWASVFSSFGPEDYTTCKWNKLYKKTRHLFSRRYGSWLVNLPPPPNVPPPEIRP